MKYKPLDCYEEELRESIKIIRKLNRGLSKVHWCDRTFDPLEDSQKKIEEFQPYRAGDLTQR
jgi:hypothetical protein